MTRSYRAWGLAVVLAASLTLSACSDPTGSQGGRGSGDGAGTVNLFMYQKPAGVFGPLAPPSGPDQQVIALIFEGLMVASPQGELEPALAASAPEISADGRTTTWTLKEGLTWSDGEPITSEDVLFTFTRAADPQTTGGFSASFTGVDGLQAYLDGDAESISGLEAPDETTVSVTTTEPDTGLAGRIATIGIVPEHATQDLPVKDFSTDEWFQAPEVTSGPFTFDEYKTDQYVHVVANPEFREPVGLKDIYLKPVTADVATQQLSTGEMDIASISPNDIDAVEGFGGVEVVESRQFGFVRAAWNQEQPRFADPRVKQAFLYAVDRAGLVDTALQGKGEVRNSVLDPIWSGDGLQSYEHDPDRARQLLEQADFDFSQPVELAWIAGSNPDRDAAATVMQDQLEEVGVRLELNQVQASWYEGAYSDHDFDMSLFGGGDYATEPSNVGPITNCDQGQPVGPNNGLYCNEELDGVVAQALRTVDEGDRAALYEQAATIENEDPSQMWLFSPNNVFGVSDRVQGFQPGDLAKYFEPWKWQVAG